MKSDPMESQLAVMIESEKMCLLQYRAKYVLFLRNLVEKLAQPTPPFSL